MWRRFWSHHSVSVFSSEFRHKCDIHWREEEWAVISETKLAVTSHPLNACRSFSFAQSLPISLLLCWRNAPLLLMFIVRKFCHFSFCVRVLICYKSNSPPLSPLQPSRYANIFSFLGFFFSFITFNMKMHNSSFFSRLLRLMNLRWTRWCWLCCTVRST